MSADTDFEYKQKASSPLIGLLFTGVLLYWSLTTALTNHAGIVIKGISLTPTQATIFFWLSTALIGFMFLCCSLILFLALTVRNKIELRVDRLIFPRGGFSKKSIEVPYTSIKRVYLGKVDVQDYLYIEYSRGKLSIRPAMLESIFAFEQLEAAIKARTGLH